MSLTLADQYYLKALNQYPYEIEFVIENLNYALSYDEEHAPANCLLGILYMYQLKDYSSAGHYFQKAWQGDREFPDTYKYFGLLKIWLGEYNQAEIIIDRGMKVKAMDQVILWMLKAIIAEMKGMFEEAISALETAKFLSIHESRISQIDKDLSRVKLKVKTHKAKVQRFGKVRKTV